MAKKKEAYHVKPLTEGKKNIIASLINEYDIETEDDIQEAIQAAFPKTEYQRCIVHQVKNIFKYVSYKDMKDFASDLKNIYLAPDEALLKSLYLSFFQATQKWTQPIRNGGKAYGEFSVMYEGRIPL